MVSDRDYPVEYLTTIIAKDAEIAALRDQVTALSTQMRVLHQYLSWIQEDARSELRTSTPRSNFGGIATLCDEAIRSTEFVLTAATEQHPPSTSA